MEFNKSQMYELNKKFKLVLLTDDEDVDKFKADWLIITVNWDNTELSLIDSLIYVIYSIIVFSN